MGITGGGSILRPAKNLTESDLPQRIAAELLTYIRDQNLGKDDKLPSQIVLAEQLNVSRTSLREALARLETDGLIYQVHGLGTFVAEDPHNVRTVASINLSMSEMVREQGMKPGTSEVSVAIEDAGTVPPDIADYLGLDSTDSVLCVRRVRTADGAPFAYVIAYLLTDLENLDHDPESYRGSMYKYLQENCGEFITVVDASIEASIAEGEVSQKLDIPDGTPLLVLHQCHRNTEGRAIAASIDYFNQNHLKFKISRRRSGFEYLKMG